ncbi:MULTISPECIES: ANTAR domain-containing protein [unclassified Streptomyces]|uniref:ANTAR domain-containing protein n=1 Tax=unclassified Streptomyces TaxID=2593676 RepID=UPI002E36125D|nr:ANTAR domain-containing protein [Streptomyces sp. NBC_01431]
MKETDAAGAVGEPDVDAVLAEVARLREEVRHLQARVRSRPLISHAQGILEERYQLPDAESAFALLRQASQRSNIKLRVLAEAVVRTPRPDQHKELWFPGRTRQPPPPLYAIGVEDEESVNRSTVLGAVLSQSLAVTGTDMGNVQTVDRDAQGLRIERHTGLSEDFVEFFAFVGESGTSCARAAQDVALTTVHDVATDPVFTEQARHAILAADSRACHSVPLVDDEGTCVGMVSAHLQRPAADLHPAQVKALIATGRQVGRWLTWHERTVVADALEYLHALGRRA